MAFGLLVYGTLPSGVAALNDDFGYLRSVIETLQRGRPWTDDWLEPWAASLSALSAVVFKLTGSFLAATQGVAALCAAGAAGAAAVLWRARGAGRDGALVLALLLLSFPTLFWKTIEFTGMVLYLPGLLWAIWAAERRRWGLFFIAWALACASRQSAVAWLVIPLGVGAVALRRGEAWRKPGLVLVGGAGWLAVLSWGMNHTAAQRLITGSWWQRADIADAGRNLVMGSAVLGAMLGIGWFIQGCLSRRWAVPATRPLQTLGIMATTALLLVGVNRVGRMYFEHECFAGLAGAIQVAACGAIAVTGWLTVRGRIAPELLLASFSSLALVALRPAVWDYYFVDVALFALFAARIPATGEPVRAGEVWPRVLGVSCCAFVLAMQARSLWITKCRVDRDYAFGCVAEAALRRGGLGADELAGLPHGFQGWHLHPHYAAHEGAGSADIGGFIHYIREGAVELRQSPLRFWPDSRSLRPLAGEAAGRVLGSRVSRVGWIWHQRFSLLRAREGIRPTKLVLALGRYRRLQFPLTDAEWAALIRERPAAADHRE
ncbi:MAG: hypothetical protein QM691_12515 [Opitutaceae bacterium]